MLRNKNYTRERNLAEEEKIRTKSKGLGKLEGTNNNQNKFQNVFQQESGQTLIRSIELKLAKCVYKHCKFRMYQFNTYIASIFNK